MGDMNWSSGIEGAGGGALTGAALGSVVPGVGTAIGAGVGGGLGLLAGLFGNSDQDAQKQALQQYYQSVLNRQAPQAGPAAQAGYSGFRQNQAHLVDRLEAMANGQGPSLAAQQFQAATDRNNAAQMSVANSGRGGPLAQFTAANNMATMGSQTAQGAAMGRTAEELGAINQLGGVIAQGRGADENVNMFNSGQTNDMSRFNVQAKLQQGQMNDQAYLQAMGMYNTVANQPTTGDRLLAGGAGAFAQYAGHGGGGGGGYTDPSQYWQGSKPQGSLYGQGGPAPDGWWNHISYPS